MLTYKKAKYVVGLILIVIVAFFILYKNFMYKGPYIYSHEKILINYKEDLNRVQLLSQNIEVLDNKGNKATVGVQFLEGRKNIIVITPPDSGYKAGKIYTLHINSNINFNIENKVENVQQWTFKIKKDKVIKFPDKNLELAIRRQINKQTGEIYIGNINKQSVLFAESYNIENLKGIENLSALKTLNLSRNKITNIKYLKNLKNLENLSVSNNKISNISPLKGLINLKTLWLNGNQIKSYNYTKTYYNNLTAKDFKLN